MVAAKDERWLTLFGRNICEHIRNRKTETTQLPVLERRGSSRQHPGHQDQLFLEAPRWLKTLGARTCCRIIQGCLWVEASASCSGLGFAGHLCETRNREKVDRVTLGFSQILRRIRVRECLHGAFASCARCRHLLKKKKKKKTEPSDQEDERKEKKKRKKNKENNTGVAAVTRVAGAAESLSLA